MTWNTWNGVPSSETLNVSISLSSFLGTIRWSVVAMAKRIAAMGLSVKTYLEYGVGAVTLKFFVVGQQATNDRCYHFLFVESLSEASLTMRSDDNERSDSTIAIPSATFWLRRIRYKVSCVFTVILNHFQLNVAVRVDSKVRIIQ